MEKPRDHCIRCGECCLRSSPSLQASDAPLVYKNLIKRSDLYSVRVGELVRDNIRGELKITDTELIKVREKEPGGGCVFYDDTEKKCTVYRHRPVQCRALKCWDESEFMRVYASPKAGRREIISDHTLLRLIDRHEERCAYARLEGCVNRIKGHGREAVESVLQILKFDHDIRRLIPEKLDVDPGETDLILGRPLTKTIIMFGLKVVRQPDGTFFLTLLDSSL
ncbi:MAG: YkgJ family cysteine cluster protein [Deltaproteobacteria bacterium]|nr:YkgJ family cysteine cluster protein [Deltaproteobacteria bacterium]MBW2047512.1 YkgJ family cysteine cluster protein [Deltaproteobacteria bacterium]MBW2111738.1 YkgJ family cysteine cluster protein [Deltaproteobacteria bacterium]MBW2352103.1 YkgJ family cysteine cluster protein [Deltaproteobacteria bacterium]HDZ89759.1 YkgJ family cysteine cluster protein [Deltaproteobacteria bacterium]